MRGVEERPEGLRYVPDLLTPEEEGALLARLRAMRTEPVVMHGVASRREVSHFGVRYDYGSFGATPAGPLPDHLVALRERAARLAGVEPAGLVEALVTRYPPQATIGWHRDAPVFGAVVVGVSLAADAVMRFQRGKGDARRVFEQPLARRSAYVLAGAARSSWQHSVPAVVQERWSVTFRQLRG